MVDIRASLVVPTSDNANDRLNVANDESQLSPFIHGQKEMVQFADDVIASAFVHKKFILRLSLFTAMHKKGYGFLTLRAGSFRSVPVMIANSKLMPPPPSEVIALLEDMCDYVNENLQFSSKYHIGAYLMWRFLWIHPFVDGNGSIARLASYIVMQIKTTSAFGDKAHMFEGISDHREEYYDALSHADEEWSRGRLNLSRLEEFLQRLLSGKPIS